MGLRSPIILEMAMMPDTVCARPENSAKRSRQPAAGLWTERSAGWAVTRAGLKSKDCRRRVTASIFLSAATPVREYRILGFRGLHQRLAVAYDVFSISVASCLLGFVPRRATHGPVAGGALRDARRPLRTVR